MKKKHAFFKPVFFLFTLSMSYREIIQLWNGVIVSSIVVISNGIIIFIFIILWTCKITAKPIEKFSNVPSNQFL